MVEYERWTNDESPPGVEIPEGVVVRWLYDDDYSTQGSYAYDSDEETRQAEEYETGKLNSGEWVALGYVVEDVHGEDYESLWGIVIEPLTHKMVEFFQHYTPAVPSAIDVAQARYDRACAERVSAAADLVRLREAS